MVIIDVEATRSIRQAEVGAAHTMLDRTEDRFGLKPGYLTADTAYYGTAQTLAWLVKQKQITPHIPVCDKSKRTDGTFSRSDFAFDAEVKRYSCPAGKHLIQFRRAFTKPRNGVTAEGTRVYLGSTKDCGICHLKARCCPNTPARKIPRDVEEDSRDVARALATTPEFKVACRRRKKVEMLFAHLKRILRLGRSRLRSEGRIPARRNRAKPAEARPIAASNAANGGGGGIGRRKGGHAAAHATPRQHSKLEKSPFSRSAIA